MHAERSQRRHRDPPVPSPASAVAPQRSCLCGADTDRRVEETWAAPAATTSYSTVTISFIFGWMRQRTSTLPGLSRVMWVVSPRVCTPMLNALSGVSE